MKTTNMNTTNNTEVAANKKENKKVSIKMIALYAFIGGLISATSSGIGNIITYSIANADTVIEAEETVSLLLI